MEKEPEKKWLAFSVLRGYRWVSEEEMRNRAVAEAIVLAIVLTLALTGLGIAWILSGQYPTQPILPH